MVFTVVPFFHCTPKRWDVAIASELCPVTWYGTTQGVDLFVFKYAGLVHSLISFMAVTGGNDLSVMRSVIRNIKLHGNALQLMSSFCGTLRNVVSDIKISKADSLSSKRVHPGLAYRYWLI